MLGLLPLVDATTGSLFLYFNAPSVYLEALRLEPPRRMGGGTPDVLVTEHLSTSHGQAEKWKEVGTLASSWSWVVVQGLGWVGLEGTCHFCLWLKKPGEKRTLGESAWSGMALV